MKINRIHISEIIGGRYDSAFVLYKSTFNNFKYPTKKLGDLLLRKPQYGANESGINRSDILSPRYIRITDIDENGNLSEELGATAETIEDKYVLYNDDILIARSGNTVGKAYIHKKDKVDYDCFFAGYMIRFIANSNQIIPDYLFIVTQLPFYKEWLKAVQRTTGQPNINAEEYKSLPIPLPSIEIQEEIVEVDAQARSLRQTKEQEAKNLLISIDSYLLDQLGVVNQKGQKCQQSFTTNIGSMIGQRFDVSFYKDRFEIKSPIYPNHKLSDMVVVNPSVKFKLLTDDDEISFVPMEAINETFGEIAEKRTTTIAKTKGFTKFEEGDLLWAKITPCMQNGKSAIAYNLTNGVGCGSTEFYVLRPKDESVVSIEYIYNLLRHYSVLEAAKSSFGGSAGQQRVSSGYLKSISIPVPPIEVQRNITNAITEKKVQAKRLRQEGVALLAEAKTQIEKIILG
jgi:restriction endonuclease S subunit